MHERRLIADLVRELEHVAAAEGGGRVVRVHVRLGALSHLTPEHFREHFADATQGSCAAGADVVAETDDDIAAPAAQGVVLESVELEAP